MSAPASLPAIDRGSSLGRDAWQRLRRNRLAVAGGVMLLLLAVACVFGPMISAYGYADQNLDNTFAPPNGAHWLGTDQLGRDLLVRVLYGGRISLGVGLCATFVALTIGVVYGAVAGYVGGRTDAVMMRLVDIMYALPFTIFVILLMVFFGRNIVLLFVAIGAVEWLTMARIVRGQTLSLKQKEFVEAARAAGVSGAGIVARHIAPNLLGPVVIYVTLTIPGVILAESFLSFLGMGVQEPLTSLGTLISKGAQDMELAPWLLIFPSIVMVVTLMCFNFIGDGLRDAIDPKDR